MILTKVVEDYKRSRSTVVSHLRRKFSDGTTKTSGTTIEAEEMSRKIIGTLK